MDLALHRSMKRPDGIFSNLLKDDDSELCVTLEHSYASADSGWEPKIYPGEFQCVRGKHRLHGMDHDFETFEITGVVGHVNLLFHWGNWNENSEGCILLGEKIVDAPHAGAQHVDMVTNSRVMFAEFMRLQEGVDRFLLRVFDA